MTAATDSRTRRPVGRAVLLIGAGLVLLTITTTAVGLVLAGGVATGAPPGIAPPDPLVTWGAPILRALTLICGIATIGMLLAAAFLDPAGRNGMVSIIGRRDLLRAGRFAIAWAVLAALQALVELALILQLPIGDAVDPRVLATYGTDVPVVRALLIITVIALVIAALSVISATTGIAALLLVLACVALSLPGLAGHGAGLGDHALALTAATGHSVAAALWIGGLLALGAHALRTTIPVDHALRRFSRLALVCISVLAVSGLANAYTRLESADQLMTTTYGRVIVAKTVLIIGLGVIGFVMRSTLMAQRGRLSGFLRIAGLELVLMASAVGLGVALATSPPPRFTVQLPSLGETLLGFAYPPPPTVGNVVVGWHPDALFLTLGLTMAALYGMAVWRLHHRGDRWPIGRTISWFVGVALLLWCTNAPIAAYSQVSVGLHMVQHMTMTMLTPIFLVLGAPATIALRALKPTPGPERGPREWLVWLLGSPVTRVLTNPFFVFAIYVVGLYVLYFTPLFGWLMGSHLGHVVMELHFLISGYLFAWILIGIDPRPKPLPYWGRLLMLLLALAVHGFFAVALMMRNAPLAPEWYSLVQPDWVSDPIADSAMGAQVAWGLSEIPTVVLIIVIAIQWARSDDREARRSDRQADRDGDAELTAYNAHLAALDAATRRRTSGSDAGPR